MTPSPLAGVLIVDKPVGITSMTAVAIIRRKAGGAKTGHAGTLDPLASGVLVTAIGKATKAIDQLMATDKRYDTTIDLSAFTTTDDMEGIRTDISVPEPPTEETLRAALMRFIGTREQQPPAFSAVKVQGRRSYQLARRGESERPAARPVTVHALSINRYAWPLLDLSIHCGKGFYVRSLARDLGTALGTGGHCTMIRRTAVGPFTLAHARPLDDLPGLIATSDMIPTEQALELVRASVSSPGAGGAGLDTSADSDHPHQSKA